MLSLNQQSAKIKESEGIYLNYLHTSEGGVMLSLFFCKSMFATSESCPLGPAKVCVILEDGAGEAKPSRTSKYCVVELKQHSTTVVPVLVLCCTYWNQERA